MAFHWDQLARSYHEEIITPFAAGVDFPLAADVDARLAGWRHDAPEQRRWIVDFGCGCGEALVLVAAKGAACAGIDLSVGMLEESEARLREVGGEARLILGDDAIDELRRSIETDGNDEPTLLVQADLRTLELLAGSVDLALAVNSICPATTAEAGELFASIAATVAPGGSLIGVFPSLDTMDHLVALHARAGLDFSGVGEITVEAGGAGLFVDASGEQQKYFRPEEIRSLVANAGLELERLDKIEYPWPLMRDSGWGHFPDAEPVWDWYLVARRP